MLRVLIELEAESDDAMSIALDKVKALWFNQELEGRVDLDGAKGTYKFTWSDEEKGIE